MAYHILPYTYKRARVLGVTVKPSTVAGKKLDVFKEGRKVATVGDILYRDYPTFLRDRGVAYANRRRTAYKKRHETDRHIRGSNGWYADQLLW